MNTAQLHSEMAEGGKAVATPLCERRHTHVQSNARAVGGVDVGVQKVIALRAGRLRLDDAVHHLAAQSNIARLELDSAAAAMFALEVRFDLSVRKAQLRGDTRRFRR